MQSDRLRTCQFIPNQWSVQFHQSKKVKLSAKQWNWVQHGEIKNDLQLRQNRARTNKMNFITKQYKARQNYQTSYREVCQIRNIHKMLMRKWKNKSQTWVDWIKMRADRDGMTKSQLKKSIWKCHQYYEAKREEGPNKTSWEPVTS